MDPVRKLGDVDLDAVLASITKDPDWLQKIGMGGLFCGGTVVVALGNPAMAYVTLPVALCLAALVCGYLVRVIRLTCLNKEALLPSWDGWAELFMSGLSWLAVQVGLWFVLTLCLGGAMHVSSWLLESQSNYFPVWSTLSLSVMGLMAAVVSLFLPFLMVNFALEERPSGGLAFRKVWRRLVKCPREFILAWLLTIGISWMSIIVPSLTIIGVFLTPSTYFYGQVVSAMIAALLWGGDN